MNNFNQSKKPFDRAVCFTFFGNWFEILEELDEHSAYCLFRAIANYALYDIEANFDEFDPKERRYIKGIWSSFLPQIDASINKRKNGFAKEAPTEMQEAIINKCAAYPGKSLQEIADEIGCHKSFVGKTKKQYRNKINEQAEKMKRGAFISEVVDTDDNTHSGNYIAELEEIEDDDNELPF